MSKLPLSKSCPECGADSYRSRLAFVDLRECKDCGQEYIYPMHPIGALIFITVGVVGFATMLIVWADKGDGITPESAIRLAVSLLGAAGMVGLGVYQLWLRRSK